MQSIKCWLLSDVNLVLDSKLKKSLNQRGKQEEDKRTMTQHKVYMNQIHGSSLLCELAQMWRSQALCDAIIKAGASTARVHMCFLLAWG